MSCIIPPDTVYQKNKNHLKYLDGTELLKNTSSFLQMTGWALGQVVQAGVGVTIHAGVQEMYRCST